MANKKPGYVNEVPEWYGPDWPEERRCRYAYSRLPGDHWGLRTEGRCCGYPVNRGRVVCCFHAYPHGEGRHHHSEIQRASAAGVCLNEARLAHADLSGLVLCGAELSGANLAGSNLAGADLCRASLSYADLRGADLSAANLEQANLCCANLSGANLSGAKLSGASLSDAVLRGADLSRADLRRANMLSADLTEAELSAAVVSGAALSGATLARARFSGPANLQGARLYGAWLAGAEFSPDADLDRITWRRPRRKPLNPILGRWRRVQPPPYRHRWVFFERPWTDDASAERTYRQIKQNYQQHGQYDLAGEFFIREMECKRKQSTGRHRAMLWLMRALSDYFESPGKLLAIAAVIVVLCAWLHGVAGIVDGSGAPVVGPGLAWPDVAGISQFISRALYYSTVTFTTLGYGDYHAANGCGRILSAVEAATGVVMAALFAVCLARRYGRT